METNNTDKAGLNNDPRIDSPQIRVIYPTEVKPKPAEQYPPKDKSLIQSVATTTSNTNAQTTPTTLSFKDAFMLYKGTFALLGLGCIALGYFIAKK